jgi:hypothetical protein
MMPEPIMPGEGIDFVLPSDYDKLVVARQQEMAYIAEVLARIRKERNAETVRAELDELSAWLNNRRTCYQPGVDTHPAPVQEVKCASCGDRPVPDYRLAMGSVLCAICPQTDAAGDGRG